jgi:cell shape-determining protein MreC
LLFYFRASIFSGFSYVGLGVFRPVISVGNNLGEKLKSINAYFSSKDSLYRENEDLKLKLDSDRENRANYDSVVAENIELKDILGRKNEQVDMILGVVLAKPNQSIYDTLLIDIGINHGVKVGDKVFASGNIPIGTIREVYPSSAKVVLFSNSGEVTSVIVSGKNVSMELVGRGGGNFEMTMPRDFTLLKGDQVVLPSINNHVVAIVETIISDSRDAFQKAILVSPVNFQQLKFVQVEK